jgi:hypothetical protein
MSSYTTGKSLDRKTSIRSMLGVARTRNSEDEEKSYEGDVLEAPVGTTRHSHDTYNANGLIGKEDAGIRRASIDHQDRRMMPALRMPSLKKKVVKEAATLPHNDLMSANDISERV